MTVDALVRMIAGGSFDFVDFGCSNGGSIRFAQNNLGGTRGLGIDLDPKKVEAATSAGYDAVVADATQVPSTRDGVRFCTMLHFLEHLPGRKAAGQCIRTAVLLAREFVYIRQPWFEGSASLIPLGYKPYWADWSGHPNHYSALDFINLLTRMRRVQRYMVFGKTRVRTTKSPILIPLLAPTNSGSASAEDLSARKEGPIPTPFFHELVCIVQVGSSEAFAPALSLTEKDHELIYDFQRTSDSPPTR